MKYYTKKAWDNALLILMEASPNAFQRNKQPTPTPYRYIGTLLRGGGIYASNGVVDAVSFSELKIGDFPLNDTQKRFSVCMSCRLLRKTTQIYEIFFKTLSNTNKSSPHYTCIAALPSLNVFLPYPSYIKFDFRFPLFSLSARISSCGVPSCPPPCIRATARTA